MFKIRNGKEIEMAKFGETKLSNAVLEIIDSVEKTKVGEEEKGKKEFQQEVMKLKEGISTEDKEVKDD